MEHLPHNVDEIIIAMEARGLLMAATELNHRANIDLELVRRDTAIIAEAHLRLSLILSLLGARRAP